jgi:hypothetical protein
MKLHAGRWSTDGATKYADSAFNHPENIGVNWRLDSHGVGRIEVTVRTRNKIDQYDRYKNHLGHRIALYGSDCYRPISGFITDVEYAGAGRVTYTAKGPGACRLEDEYYTTVQATATGLDNLLAAMLTASVSVSSSDQSNIDNNTTTASGWQPNHPEGSLPRDVIQDILKMSDSSGNIWDFWFLDPPFSGVSLGDYLPYYKARSETADADWVVYRRDLSRISLARDINDLKTDVTVYYGTITGTHDTSSSGLRDSSVNFRTLGVQPGDRITNITDGCRARVAWIDPTNDDEISTTGLSGGSTNDFTIGDTYAIELQEPKYTQTDSVTASYWTREYADSQPKMTSAQASQYADILKDTEPRQVQSFTVGAPWIRDGNGAKWPLWAVVAQGGGYLRVADLYPAAALFSTSADKLTTFRITGLDYDYAGNSLSVTVQDPSLRLDARLRRAGIVGSDMVQRAPRRQPSAATVAAPAPDATDGAGPGRGSTSYENI